MSDMLTPVLSDNWDADRAWTLESYERSGGYEALKQARTFLARAEAAYAKAPKDQTVVQFARTSAQSAENARALAMGAVGGLLMRQLESELKEVRDELAKLRQAEAAGKASTTPAPIVARVEPAPAPPAAPAAPPPLARQPALWFAVAGWGVALVMLFRRRTI